MKSKMHLAALASAIMGAVFASGAERVYPVREAGEVMSLDGAWSMTLVRNGVERPDSVLKTEGEISVPGNWETQGWKVPQYGNQIQDLTGVYRRKFAWNERWAGRKVMLRFDGVLFGYDVEINSKSIARNVTSAFNLHQFDITDALKEGENEIVVTVRTRARGWLFDTNDCWCLAGIFRSVEIFSVPKDGWIEDITFTGGADGRVTAKIETTGGREVRARLVAPDGGVVREWSGDGNFDGAVAPVLTWTPQTPHLYTLEVEYNGQRVSERVGFRTVSWDARHICVNGEAVKLRGVCWNEILPETGRAITRTQRRAEMERMKAAGINCIRTAHYPFGVDFCELADEMGFFVIEEVPFGSRGDKELADAAYEEDLLDRTERTMRRDKNHPSIIAWTFGNENFVYDNTIKVLDYAKSKDPTRPRGLPMYWYKMLENWLTDPRNSHVDFFCGHYLTPEELDIAAKSSHPLIQTEFSHALGNGFGNFEDRWQRILATDNFAGGCVWMWRDQAVETDGVFPLWYEALGGEKFHRPRKDRYRRTGKNLQGVWTDDGRFLDSFGDRGSDGICYADGTPKESFYVVQALYAPKNGVAKECAMHKPDCTLNPIPDMPKPFLRVAGREALIGFEGGWNSPYILPPHEMPDGRIRWYRGDDETSEEYFEGTVILKDGILSYDVTPSAKCTGGTMLAGISFSFDERFTRLDWAGLGPFTSVPGKSVHNSLGVWSRHKDDIYFEGNRLNAAWVLVSDGGEGILIAAESPMNVFAENIGGKINLTLQAAVKNPGDKIPRSKDKFAVKDLHPKGSFRVSEAKNLVLAPVAPFAPLRKTY